MKRKDDPSGLLTARRKRAYLRHEGNHCPLCNSQDIEGTGQHEADADWHTNEVRCNACGAVWDDIYTLSDLQITEPPTSSGPMNPEPHTPGDGRTGVGLSGTPFTGIHPASKQPASTAPKSSPKKLPAEAAKDAHPDRLAITITVHGGIVQDIFGSIPDVEVEVVDYDNAKEDGTTKEVEKATLKRIAKLTPHAL